MKLALVTGGLHRVGAVIAARLAEAGWTLALHGRTPGAPDPALAAVLARAGMRWQAFFADLAEARAPQELLAEVEQHFGALPGLIVNNAARFGWDDVETVTPESLAAHHAVNTAAPVMLAVQLARVLPPGENAAVVNILDQRIRHPAGDQLSYTLAKCALASATQALARALAPRIRVNGVAPGLVLPTEDYLPAQMRALEAMMPLARLAEPEDVAEAVLWLAGAEATTGQIVYVDGGANLRAFERDFLFMGREA